MLLGATPDVSVYLGGAVRLVHGAVPYRDYVFVQPPGFVLLAAPIGFLADLIGTRDALGALRLLTPLLAAANVLLVGRLVRHRGLAATVVACAVMACFPAELYAIRGPQLEPVVDLVLLIGAALVFEAGAVATRRRVVIGGLVLGLAVAVKLSAAIPVAVLVVVCVAATRQRAVVLIAAVVGGFAVVTLPFVALAPASFWQDVVVTQLGRVPATDRATFMARLGEMTGLSEIGATPAAVIVVSALLVAAVATVFVASRRRPTRAGMVRSWRDGGRRACAAGAGPVLPAVRRAPRAVHQSCAWPRGRPARRHAPASAGGAGGRGDSLWCAARIPGGVRARRVGAGPRRCRGRRPAAGRVRAVGQAGAAVHGRSIPVHRGRMHAC